MTTFTTQSRRIGKTSRARTAVRFLRSMGYEWSGKSWVVPQPVLQLAVRECDIDQVHRKRGAMNKSSGLHQIAEPGQSTGGCKV